MSDNNFTYTMVPLKEQGFFWVTFTGQISMDNLGRAHRDFTHHPDYAPHIDELLDFRNASIGQLTKSEIEIIRQTMRQLPDRHDSKSAIVVSSQLDYGIGRIMGAQLDRDIPVERAMFYSIEEALEWLHPGQASELIEAHQTYVENE
jgi:hypothetical protein